jgi:hypothetical protein
MRRLSKTPSLGSRRSVRAFFAPVQSELSRSELWMRAVVPSNGTDQTRIEARLQASADAVRRHDVPAILAHHQPDMVMFDLPPPL